LYEIGSTISSLATINAGVVQESALGPAAFIICASDLHAITPGNKLVNMQMTYTL